MRPIMSAKLTPLAATRMRTSPAAGAGSGACFICRTSGPPALVIQICFMGVLDVASGAKCLPRAPSPLRLALRPHRHHRTRLLGHALPFRRELQPARLVLIVRRRAGLRAALARLAAILFGSGLGHGATLRPHL